MAADQLLANHIDYFNPMSIAWSVTTSTGDTLNCSISLTSGTACSDGSVQLTLNATCSTDCGSIGWSITNNNPYIRITPNSGSIICHGGSSGRYDRIKEKAFEYAFLFDTLGIKN